MEGDPHANEEGQPALPDLEVLQIIESWSVEERLENKRRLLEEISQRENLVHQINDVNDAEGVDNVTIIY